MSFSLLHDQVVKRMRSRACVNMSPMPGLMRVRVGAERVSSLFATKPMKAQVGAILGVHHLVSMSDVKDCASAVKFVIDRLHQDLITFFNARWFEILKAGKEVDKQEEDYVARWNAFKLSFEVWKTSEVNSCPDSINPVILGSFGCFPGPLYDQCAAFNEQHDQWYDSFQKDFKGVVSGPKNEKIKQPELNLPNPLDLIPWKTILVGGFALGGFMLWSHHKVQMAHTGK
jgi:hypothetical protein